MKAWQGTVSSGVWTAQNTQTFASAYQYDFNGNLVQDTSEGKSLINWTVTGKGHYVLFEYRTRINVAPS